MSKSAVAEPQSIETFEPVPFPDISGSGDEPLANDDLKQEEIVKTGDEPDHGAEPELTGDIDLPELGIKKQEPRQSDKPPGDRKPDDGKPKDKLRQEMDRINDLRRAVETERDELKSQLQEIADRAAKAEEEAKRYRDEVNKARESGEIGNIYEHPEVAEIVEPFNAKAATFNRALEESGVHSNEFQEKSQGWIGRYMAAGEPGSEEFRNEAQSIRREIAEMVPEDLVGEAMALIRTGASITPAVHNKVSELRGNLPKLRYSRELESYNQAKKVFAEASKGVFEPSDDIAASNPFNQSVVLSKMIEEDEQIKAAAMNAKVLTELILLPIKPLNPSEIEHLEGAERDEAITRHLERFSSARKKGARILPEAILAYQLLPSLIKRVHELEGRVRDDDTPTPKHGEDNFEPINDQTTIESFEPKNDALGEFR